MQIIDIFLLRNPNLDPEMKELREKYQLAIEEWNELIEKYRATQIEVERRQLEQKLSKVNKKVGRLKKEIIAKNDS
jgi:hypothetical protein